MMKLNVVYDNICNVFEANAATARDLNICASSIDSLVAVYYKLSLEFYQHITGENNPKWLGFGDSVSERTRIP